MEEAATLSENRSRDGHVPEQRIRQPIHWIHKVRVDGAVAFRAGRRGGGLVAHWPGLGMLTCARDGSDATFVPAAKAATRFVEKLRRAQVRGLLRDLAGAITVHGSAAGLAGRGVLFLGENGAGKSTAAAELCLRYGAHMFADDVASIDVRPSGVELVPSEEDHWLTPESRGALGVAHPTGAPDEKRELRSPAVASERCPLRLIAALRFDDHVAEAEMHDLRGTEAAMWLLQAAFRFDVDDAAARLRELDQLLMIHDRVRFVEIVRPRRVPGGVGPLVVGTLKSFRP
jgi:hypothetical protein